MTDYTSSIDIAAFSRSEKKFYGLVGELSRSEMAMKTHAEIENYVATTGRELMCSLFQDHLDLRSTHEVRQDTVVGPEGGIRTRVESGHHRQLETVVGEVTVTRIAYRSPDVSNVHPADAILNLPRERHSHGLRKLAVLEAVRGSFEDTLTAMERTTGLHLGKRQVEELVARAAANVDDFYAIRTPGSSPPTDTLVLSVDGKGIVMRHDALRTSTARAAENAAPKLTTRLSRGEKANRKRMAEVGAVYDITPVSRLPSDIITRAKETRTPGPRARDKWLVASVKKDPAEVIGLVFDEAERRDPEHRRPWLALVDGNAHQISCITAEATRRKVNVTILLDFVHVLEYLWKAAWCFFDEGDAAAEKWVATHAVRILEGNSGVVAAAIRRKATYAGLTAEQGKGAEICANYLINKGRYLGYATALESGWPIATGIIEGACRHLVKDRMDLTGSRWGLKGAEAILKLRALVSNGDLDEYWKYHLAREHQQIHPHPGIKEQSFNGLALAA